MAVYPLRKTHDSSGNWIRTVTYDSAADEVVTDSPGGTTREAAPAGMGASLAAQEEDRARRTRIETAKASLGDEAKVEPAGRNIATRLQKLEALVADLLEDR